MSPVVLAANLGIKPKTLRAWLTHQELYTDPAKRGNWEVPKNVAMDAWWHFRGRHL